MIFKGIKVSSVNSLPIAHDKNVLISGLRQLKLTILDKRWHWLQHTSVHFAKMMDSTRFPEGCLEMSILVI